jgi:hypothetical protein
MIETYDSPAFEGKVAVRPVDDDIRDAVPRPSQPVAPALDDGRRHRRRPFSPQRGVVPVPTGPGLGVELDEEALARCVDRFAREGAYDFYASPPLPRF